MRRVIIKSAALAVAMTVTILGGPNIASAASYTLIQGSGSSWAANAVNQWVADVDAKGMKIVYTANGAAQGRKDFANKSTDFGVTDAPFRGKDPTTGAPDTSLGRDLAYLPVVSGGTAFPYHLEIGGKLVRNLRLSGEVVAKIFTNQITNWNDPAITKDNNGSALPSIPIIPVVRSDGAGITNQFTTWLVSQYPDIWKDCNGGKAAPSDYFPLNCGKSSGPQKAQAGSDGIMNFIKSKDANGSIAMEEYSYPLMANYPVAKLLNKSGYYTLPTQYNVAVALTRAVINDDKNSPEYLTQKLDDVYVNADKRTYPLSSYVYGMIPTASDDKRMTTSKRQTLADFLYFSICQGQTDIGPIGYSPLPVNLVQAGFEQIGKLKAADPGVDLAQRDVSTCNNPTFVKDNPSKNYLAEIAPLPPACDQQGNGPCAAGEGAYNANPGGEKAKTKKSGPKAAAPETVPDVAAPAAAPVEAGSPVASDLGVPIGDTAVASSGGAAVPVTLSADQQGGPPPILTTLVIGLFLAILVIPATATAFWNRRRRP